MAPMPLPTLSRRWRRSYADNAAVTICCKCKGSPPASRSGAPSAPGYPAPSRNDRCRTLNSGTLLAEIVNSPASNATRPSAGSPWPSAGCAARPKPANRLAKRLRPWFPLGPNTPLPVQAPRRVRPDKQPFDRQFPWTTPPGKAQKADGARRGWISRKSAHTLLIHDIFQKSSTVEKPSHSPRKAAISPAKSAGSGEVNSNLSPVTGWSNPRLAACRAWRGKAFPIPAPCPSTAPSRFLPP